jgi:tRNA nucleotidyltransferase/poly(A) polymerase
MGRLKNNSPIDENTFFILDLFEKCGYETRVVGGAVRNFLLKKEISDIDIATTATVAEISDICARHKLVMVPIGIRYGSVLILRNSRSYEITTLREDVETFGRHAKVKFSKSFEADSRRRDFTINAIYMDKNQKIYDYHSGIEDISTGNIRFIGNARERISEDYLRILRYFRFVASYGNYECNQEYLNTIAELKNGVSILSSERIVSELLKIFEIDDSYKIIPPMWEILNELFSLKFNSLEICEKLGIFESLSNIERLAILLKFSDSNELIDMYNFPRVVKERIKLKPVDRRQVFQQLKQIRKEYRSFYVKFWAVNSYLNNSQNPCDTKDFLKKTLDFCQSEDADFKLRARDLERYNLTDEELKLIMMAAKKFWIENPVSHGECIEFAEKYLDEL